MQKQKQNIKLDIRTNKLIQKNPTQFQIRASFIAMVSQIILLSLVKIISFVNVSLTFDFFSAIAIDFFIYIKRTLP